MTIFLMDEAALRARCASQRSNMLARAKPRYYKRGKLKGKLRIPGITKLPFTTEQLWQRSLDQIGPGAVKCPYCVAIGRPANIITLANFVWDHKVPASRGGSYELKNLCAVCEDCNRLKGSMSYDFFIALLSEVFLWDDPLDVSYFLACLRKHGKTIRFQGGKKPAKEEVPQPAPPPTGKLALYEDF